jgi:hypothetical protein
MVPVSLVCFIAVNDNGCYRIMHTIIEYKRIWSLAQRNVNRRDLEWGLKNESNCISMGKCLSLGIFTAFGELCAF